MTTVALAVASVLASCTGSSGPVPPSTAPPGSSASPSAPAPHPSQPNVVVLLSDDQAFRIFDRSLMPNVFGQLVDKGVNFTRAYVNVSQCCPSRASILTGLYSHDTGVDSNTVPLDGRLPLRPVFPTALREAGYTTGLFGKYLNSEPCAPQPGWDRWVCGTPNTEVNPELNIDGQRLSFKGYTADILASRAVDFIHAAEAKNQPFFVYYAPKDPHLPANDPRDKRPVPPYEPPSLNADPQPASKPAWTRLPPLDARNLGKAQNWHTLMTRQIPPLDAAMGTILRAIGRQSNETLVIFMSDNGFMYGEHRMTSKNEPYEESVRVPMVIRFPQVLPEDQAFSSSALLSNVDLAPTIMDAAGIPWKADGTSLLPLVGRKSATVRDGLLIEWCQAGHTKPCQSEKKAEELNVLAIPNYWELETERYAYVEYATGERELYDLVSDPYEMTNLASDPAHASLVARLHAQLAALRAPPQTPDTTIATGPTGTVTTGKVTFVFFSQSRTTGFRCKLTGPGHSGWTPCDHGWIPYRDLKPGAYTFTVQAIDAAGHPDPTPASRDFTLAA